MKIVMAGFTYLSNSLTLKLTGMVYFDFTALPFSLQVVV